jgi:hypothetical protein
MKKKHFNALMSMMTELIENGDDEQCLTVLASAMMRIKMRTRVLQDEDGIIHSQIAMFISGDKVLASTPSQFEIPMVPAISASKGSTMQ